MMNFFEIEGQDIVEPVLEEEKVKQKLLRRECIINCVSELTAV